jgi:hypothetical protein
LSCYVENWSKSRAFLEDVNDRVFEDEFATNSSCLLASLWNKMSARVISRLYNCADLSDLKIILADTTERKEFYVSRGIMANASPVLKTMLYGGFVEGQVGENSKPEVVIDSVSSYAFELICKSIYGLDFKSLLDISRFREIVEGALFLQMEQFIRDCFSCIINQITADNVLGVYSCYLDCDFFKDYYFEQHLKVTILQNPRQAMESMNSDDVQFDRRIFRFLLKCDNFHVPEEELWKIVKARGLREEMSLLRYNCMDTKFFQEEVAECYCKLEDRAFEQMERRRKFVLETIIHNPAPFQIIGSSIVDNPLLHQKTWYLRLDSDHYIDVLFPFSGIPQSAVLKFQTSKWDPFNQEAPFEIGISTLDEEKKIIGEMTFYQKRLVSKKRKRHNQGDIEVAPGEFAVKFSFKEDTSSKCWRIKFGTSDPEREVVLRCKRGLKSINFDFKEPSSLWYRPPTLVEIQRSIERAEYF